MFDDNNRLKKETDTVTWRGTDYVYGLDGTLASTTTFSRDNTETQQTSTYTYERWDDAKRKSTKLDGSNEQYVAWNPDVLPDPRTIHSWSTARLGISDWI